MNEVDDSLTFQRRRKKHQVQMNGVMCYTNEDLNKSFKSMHDSPKCFSVFADGRDQTVKEYMYDSGKITFFPHNYLLY